MQAREFSVLIFGGFRVQSRNFFVGVDGEQHRARVRVDGVTIVATSEVIQDAGIMEIQHGSAVIAILGDGAAGAERGQVGDLAELVGGGFGVTPPLAKYAYFGSGTGGGLRGEGREDAQFGFDGSRCGEGGAAGAGPKDIGVILDLPGKETGGRVGDPDQGGKRFNIGHRRRRQFSPAIFGIRLCAGGKERNDCRELAAPTALRSSEKNELFAMFLLNLQKLLFVESLVGKKFCVLSPEINDRSE